VLLLNPPYGERIEAAGVAGRQRAITESEGDFFLQLAQHWRATFGGWTAWILTPDMKLPGRMRLKENRRVPLWNGPIECRLFRIQIQVKALGSGPN
jgi:putative N6-adenine-specific DNA methylase